MPAQTTRGERAFGKKPTPAARNGNGRAFAQTAPTAAFKFSRRVTGTPPRNRSVRWNCSGLVQPMARGGASDCNSR